MNKLTTMGIFLIHWKGCSSCFPIKKFTMQSRLCPTGKTLYAATHVPAHKATDTRKDPTP